MAARSQEQLKNEQLKGNKMAKVLNTSAATPLINALAAAPLPFPIQVVGDRVVVEAVEVKLSSFLHIPDAAKEKSQRAKVIQVGDGWQRKNEIVPYPFKAGDEILITKYGGADLEIEGKKYSVICGDDVVAVILRKGAV